LHNFGDTEILRLWVPDAVIFVVFGRVVISNADGDPQNATARLTTFDGATELVPFSNRFRLFVPPIRRTLSTSVRELAHHRGPIRETVVAPRQTDVPTGNRKRLTSPSESVDSRPDLCGLIWCAIAGLFRSRAALQAEILGPSTSAQCVHARRAEGFDTLDFKESKALLDELASQC
jgi:hypothetical protein